MLACHVCEPSDAPISNCVGAEAEGCLSLGLPDQPGQALMQRNTKHPKPRVHFKEITDLAEVGWPGKYITRNCEKLKQDNYILLEATMM